MKLKANSTLEEIQQKLFEFKKSKILKNHVSLFIKDETDDHDEYSIFFEDATFDFDLIEKVVDIFKEIPNKNLLSRALIANEKKIFLEYLKIVKQNISTFNTNTINTTKSFQKEIQKMIISVQDAIDFCKNS